MSEDRRIIEDRRYAVLSKDTIKVFAETVGYKELPEDVADLLSEDVTYRLREMIQESCHFLRHGRRKKLTTEDVNSALKNSDIPPVYGHGTQEMLPFRQTKEGELYFVDDLDINLPGLAYGSQAAPKITPPMVKAYWLAVEGVQKAGSLPANLQGKGPIRGALPITDDMLQYYDNVTKAILGNEEEIMKLALVDMRTNTKISPLMPYFINFFTNGVRTVNHDVAQLTKLLHMVRAMISNQSLNLEPKPYLEMLVQGVLYCLTDPLAASINPLNDHWKLRDYAARLLAIISRDWETPLNNLREENITALQEVLYDLARPSCSHYGAVMGLTAFGTQALEDVLLPHLSNLWPHLESNMNANTTASSLVKADAFKVCGAILLAGEWVMKARVAKLLSAEQRSHFSTQNSSTSSPAEQQTPSGDSCVTGGATQGQQKDVSSEAEQTSDDVQVMDTSELIGPILQLPETSNPYKKLLEIYLSLYEYFGDGLAIRCPIRHPENIYIQKKQETPKRLIEDPEANKSGEELLKEFMVAAESEAPMDETEIKSENQSFDHAQDDDLEEKSERSSRSSRSGRSLSDENSFLGEDSDLTVKATVSDPSQGIKLTILKRPKLKMSEPMMEGDDPEWEGEAGSFSKVTEDDDDIPMPVLELKPEPLSLRPEDFIKTSKCADIKEVFDIEAMVQNNVFFMFRFLGCEQLCSSRRNSNRMSSVELVDSKANVKLWSHLLKLVGKMPPKSNRVKKRHHAHFQTGNIEAFL